MDPLKETVSGLLRGASSGVSLYQLHRAIWYRINEIYPNVSYSEYKRAFYSSFMDENGHLRTMFEN